MDNYAKGALGTAWLIATITSANYMADWFVQNMPPQTAPLYTNSPENVSRIEDAVNEALAEKGMTLKDADLTSWFTMTDLYHLGRDIPAMLKPIETPDEHGCLAFHVTTNRKYDEALRPVLVCPQ